MSANSERKQTEATGGEEVQPQSPLTVPGGEEVQPQSPLTMPGGEEVQPQSPLTVPGGEEVQPHSHLSVHYRQLLQQMEEQAKGLKDFKGKTIQVLKESGASDDLIRKIEYSPSSNIVRELSLHMSPVDCPLLERLVMAYNNDTHSLSTTWEQYSDQREMELKKSLHDTDMISIPKGMVCTSSDSLHLHLQTSLTTEKLTLQEVLQICSYLVRDMRLEGVKFVGVANAIKRSLVFSANKRQESSAISSWKSKQEELRKKFSLTEMSLEGSFQAREETHDQQLMRKLFTSDVMEYFGEVLKSTVQRTVQTAMEPKTTMMVMEQTQKVERLQNQIISLTMKLSMLKDERTKQANQIERLLVNLKRQSESEALKPWMDKMSNKLDAVEDILETQVTDRMKDPLYSQISTSHDELMKKMQEIQDHMPQRRELQEVEVQTESLNTPEQGADCVHEGLLVPPSGRPRSLLLATKSESTTLEPGDEKELPKLQRKLQTSTSSFCAEVEDTTSKMSLAAELEARESREYLFIVLSQVQKIIKSKNNREVQRDLVCMERELRQYLRRGVSTEETHQIQEEDSLPPVERATHRLSVCLQERPLLPTDRERRKTL